MKRRDFLSMTVGAAAMAGARPAFATPRQTGPIGANNRIRAALIGAGGRGSAVARDWQLNKDSVFVATCDVWASRTTNSTTTLAGRQEGAKVDGYEDYRRILDRNDVDAVLIGTPDHWHSQMCIDAMSAGKDIYCEKPVSNTVEAAVKMRDAARKSNRIIQIGTQQRSWPHFQEAAKLMHDGYVGSVRHVVMMPPSAGGQAGGGPIAGVTAAQMPAEPIPDGFNWDLWQGPAERKPYLSIRTGFRSWYAYGGGSVTDWGVHLVDIMAWYLKLDNKVPNLTSASAQYVNQVKDLERVPNCWSITWQYDTFIANLTNAVLPGIQASEEFYGDWFYAQRAVLNVNRFGYDIRPYGLAPGRGGGGGGGRQGAPGAAAAAAGAPGAAAPAAGAPAAGAPQAGAAPGGGGGGRGGGRGGGQAAGGGAPAAPQPPIEAKRVFDPMGRSEAAGSTFAQATVSHVRNFLDCVRSRQQPVCNMEAGFAASIPCILANVAIREERTVKFDGNKAT
jgi:predicted dehydrogenase